MKKRRFLFLITLILITCTGCSVEYNINITKNNIEESISINDYISKSRTKQDILEHYEMWYPVFVNYIGDNESIELEDFKTKVEGIEYYQKNINKIDNGYNYKYKYIYDIETYHDSYALATTFAETMVYQNDERLVLKTGKENLLCNYDYFENLKINITIDTNVYEINYTNSNNIKNNTYTWIFDRDDCNNSVVALTLNKVNDKNSINNNEDDSINEKKIFTNYTMYIFSGTLLLLALIGYFIYNKIKKKNEKFDIDD